MSRQPLEKLHFLYENLMPNNFRKTTVLKTLTSQAIAYSSRPIEYETLVDEMFSGSLHVKSGWVGPVWWPIIIIEKLTGNACFI